MPRRGTATAEIVETAVLDIRHAGRATMLTPDVIEEVCKVLFISGRRGMAMTVSGVTPHTFYKWHRRGRDALAEAQVRLESEGIDRNRRASDVPDHDLIFAELVLAMEYVEAMREKCLLEGIQHHGSRDWKAYQYLLERSDELDKSDRQGEKHSQRYWDAKIEAALGEALSNDELRQLASLLEKVEERASKPSPREAESPGVHTGDDANVQGKLASRLARGDPGSGPVW
ncbi:MAG: hypothetical protein GY926_19375 [bacterium]|nr:hypothetical protein [bacterium]